MKKIKKSLVTITGVSGYVGSQTCLSFLKNGQFAIRGTMRSTKNVKYIEVLKRSLGDHFSELELVEADLNNDQSIRDAVKGSKYVVHTASTSMQDQDAKLEKEMIKTEMDGTLSVMKAAHEYKVKRVVYTSCTESI